MPNRRNQYKNKKDRKLQARQCTSPSSMQLIEVQTGLTPLRSQEVETTPTGERQPKTLATRQHGPGIKIMKDIEDLSLEDFDLDPGHPLSVLELILSEDDEDPDLFGEEFERMREKILEFVNRLIIRTISQRGMILAIVAVDEDLEWTAQIEAQVTDLKCSIEADVEILKFDLMEHRRQRPGTGGDAAKVDVKKE